MRVRLLWVKPGRGAYHGTHFALWGQSHGHTKLQGRLENVSSRVPRRKRKWASVNASHHYSKDPGVLLNLHESQFFKL